MKLRVCFTILIVSFSSCLPYSLVFKRISQPYAIRLAEDFVRYNGYTQMPIDTSRHKLSYTMWDGVAFQIRNYTVDSIIRDRHNTLYPKAQYIAYDKKERRWIVGFISTEFQIDRLDTFKRNSPIPGYSIIIDERDNHIEVSHINPYFCYFKKYI